jgi:hypothetical protein
MKTVKQLAEELDVSKVTSHRTLHKLKQNQIIETFQDGNKILIDETIEKAIIRELQEKSLQGEANQNDAETNQKRCRNVTETNHGNDVATIQAAYIETLQAQINDLKADKQYLQERLTAAEQERAELRAERDKLTAERQTMLVELLDLRAPKVIDVKTEPKAAASETSRTTSAPKQQPRPAQHQQRRPQKQSIFDRIFRRK